MRTVSLALLLLSACAASSSNGSAGGDGGGGTPGTGGSPGAPPIDVLPVVPPPGEPVASPTPEEAIASLEQDVGGLFEVPLVDRMAFHQTPGVSVAVVHDGALAWTHAWGVYDLVAQSPMEPDSKLQAGSISKPVTAIAILSLVEDGLLELDAPINDSFVRWQVPDDALLENNPVTLRHVLSHTAGFNLPAFFGYNADGDIPSLLQVLNGESPATNEPLHVLQAPGAGWLYSGGAYTSLAVLLEDVTGSAFGDWLENNVLTSAGMTDSSFAQPLSDPVTVGTSIGSVFGSPVEARAHPELPAAGLWSTAPDLARLVLEIQRSLDGNSGILSAATATQLIEPQSPEPNVFAIGLSQDPQMGLGLFLADGPDPSWFWHTGGNVGFTCIIVGDTRGEGFGAVVMTNAAPTGRLLAWEVINGIADLYSWPGWANWGI